MNHEDFTAWRKAMGYSKARAARELGVTPQTIHNWETGKGPIPFMAALAATCLWHRNPAWGTSYTRVLIMDIRRETMKKTALPVVDDTTRDAMILGWAESPEKALEILRGEGHDCDDVMRASLPDFSYNPDVQDADENRRAEKVGSCWVGVD
jgi:DNA-binding XRE family transcriptional regulator